MIPKELDDLIKEYLTDGIISAKERQVLLKKAQQLGLDVDEIDLYIDAQQQKADQAVDAAASKKRGKTCPYCGGTVPQLTDKCPHCGGTITPEASEELQEILDNLEEALIDFKSGNDIAKSKAVVERYVRKAKVYYGNNPRVQKLLAEIQEESDKTDELAKAEAKRKTIISILTNKKVITAVVCVLALIISGVFLSFHKSTDQEIEEVSKQVTQLVSEDKLDEATNVLTSLTFSNSVRAQGTSALVDKYDAIYFKVIDAYLKKGDLDSAESLASVYRGKIGNDMSWDDSSCYKKLKSVFAREGRDFSSLKSQYDYQDRIDKAMEGSDSDSGE